MGDLIPGILRAPRCRARACGTRGARPLFFVYIHPYFDGNGRMGRFLMNLMVAAGGWRWTLVTVDTRDAYMAALERASVHQ